MVADHEKPLVPFRRHSGCFILFNFLRPFQSTTILWRRRRLSFIWISNKKKYLISGKVLVDDRKCLQSFQRVCASVFNLDYKRSIMERLAIHLRWITFPDHCGMMFHRPSICWRSRMMRGSGAFYISPCMIRWVTACPEPMIFTAYPGWLGTLQISPTPFFGYINREEGESSPSIPQQLLQHNQFAFLHSKSLYYPISHEVLLPRSVDYVVRWHRSSVQPYWPALWHPRPVPSPIISFGPLANWLFYVPQAAMAARRIQALMAEMPSSTSAAPQTPLYTLGVAVAQLAARPPVAVLLVLEPARSVETFSGVPPMRSFWYLTGHGSLCWRS